MKFITKIWLLPLCAALILLVGLAISFGIGRRTAQTLDQLRLIHHPYKEWVGRVDHAFDTFKYTLQAVAAEGDESKLGEGLQLATSVKTACKEIQKLDGKDAAGAALRAAFETYEGAAIAATRSMLGKGTAAGELVPRMQAALTTFEQQLQAQKKAAAANVAAAQDAADAGVRQGIWVSLSTGVVLLLALAGASRLLVRSVWRDLGDEPAQLRDLVQRVAEGDLLAARMIDGAVPAASLRAAVAGMAGRLGELVQQIQQATVSIAKASDEIAVGNQDLSHRTELTASNLQETASSMEQITGTVRHSAESARQANQLADVAASSARRGGGIVADVVHNMDEINSASRRITEIIGVIDGIAFQTNILALNAAVEAARAGEHGRGFAVVAAEVRQLAQRSATSAKEIKSLIQMSGEKVESGARLVQDAGGAMAEIMQSVQRVTDIIGEISTATSQQSGGIGQVNESVTRLDQMTQQNAALVEQSSAAAESLRRQAGRLTESVSVFRVAA